MVDKYIMLDINDERAGKIADVLQNKTCKRILLYLAEHEANEVDLVKNLNIPATTVHYDIKKLLDADFVVSLRSFWSVKGKKMPVYKISDKKIVISPRNSLGTVKLLITLALTGLAAGVVKLWSTSFFQTADSSSESISELVKTSVASIPSSLPVSPNQIFASSPSPEIWLWFFLGGIFALLIHMILNWRRL